MLELSEWRDIGLILIAVCFGGLALLWLALMLAAARFGLRLLRALQRVHDQRLLGMLAAAEQHQRGWAESGLLEPRGLPDLGRRLAALRPRRRPKPKRRLWGLLPPAR